jgi:oxygen-dependent protoporphyrinogen oxidase
VSDPVVVIGGGITGLATAWSLQKQGVPYLLLEAQDRFGGVIRTESRDGFLMEGGPDSMLAQKPEAIALCRELGLGDRLIPTNQDPTQKAVYVLHRGRLHPLPEGMMLAVPTRILPFLQSGLFSWPGKLRMGLDLVIPGRPANGDESIASFLRRRFGEEAVERLGEPLLAGIHAGDPEKLSIRATFPRFVDLEVKYGSLIRGLFGHKPPPPRPGAAPASAFYSLQGGLGELVEALVARLDVRSLRANTAVSSLSREGEGFVLGLPGGERLRTRSVIVTVPAPQAARLLQALVPEAAALSAITFANTATVQLGYRREDVAHPLDGYGMVVPKAEGLRCSALSFFSTKFPGRAPAGHVLVRGFLGGIRDGSVLDLSDEEMIATVRKEMQPVLGLRGEPVLSRVFRWPSGTPQMEVGHMARMDAIEAAVAKVPGLLLTGAGIRGTGLPDCVAEGNKAAAAAATFVGTSPAPALV